MHGCVAIGAARDEGLRIMGRGHLRQGMAVGASRGLIRGEQIVGAGAMGDVAMAAIFRDRSVFVDIRTCLGLMTSGALRGLRAQADLASLVWGVAIGAAEHALAHGVMRGQVQAGRDCRMAADAEARVRACVGENVASELRRDPKVEGLAVVGIVAIRAEQPRALMRRHRPGQQTPVACLVATQTVGVGREAYAGGVHHVLEVALAGAMTRFTV